MMNLPTHKLVQIAAVTIFMSCAMIIAVSLARGDMSPVLIVNGFLMGSTTVVFSTARLLAAQTAMIESLLAANRVLMANNATMVAMTTSMQAAMQPGAPPEKPMGRVH